MPRAPIQQLVRPEVDPLFHQMTAAYHGDPATWRAVTRSMRDAMVDYARRVSPHYRRTLPPGGAFEDIPVLTREVVRERRDEIAALSFPEERRFTARSAGSTGVPVAVYRDTGQLLTDAAADRFCRWLHGVPFGATIVVTVTSPTDRLTWWSLARGRALAWVLGEPGLDPWLYPTPVGSLTPAGLPGELRAWRHLRSYSLEGPASRLDWIADQIERHDMSLPKRPVAVVATADMLSDHARRRIERVFGTPVQSRYGATEMVWIATSTPGDPHRYLINPLLVYAEVVDDAGRPVPAGTPGRLVLTDLHNWAMPLIRYDLGDIAVMSSESMGGFPIIEQLVGRASEVLRFPTGRTMSGSLVGNYLFGSIRGHEFAPHVRFFQCAQTGPNAIELRLVWDGAPEEAVRGRMVETLREIADPDTAIRVVDREELDRLPSGKLWLVRRVFQDA